MVEALIAVAALGGIVWLAIRGFGSASRPQKDSAPATWATWAAAGFLATTAITSVFAQPATAASIAAAIGAAAAIATLPGVGWMVSWLFGVTGAIAAVPAVVTLFTGDTCVAGTADRAQVVVSGVVLLIVFATTFGFTLVLRLPRASEWVRVSTPLAGLGIYGALEVVAFLNTPFGVSITPREDLWRWLFVLATTVAVAAAAAVRPELVMVAAALSILAGSLVLDGLGLSCDEGDLAGISITATATFAAIFVGTRLLIGLFRRRGV